MKSRDSTIDIRDVSVVFSPKGREPVTAVESVSLTIADGQIMSIVGPSGCGKSTLLNVISGLLKPAKGSVTVRGEEIGGIRTDVGYMFARDGLMPWRTAIENVEFGLEVRAVPKRREIAQSWLDRVGLRKFESHYRHELSQGMRQRVAVARTFATDPAILLMDEPFGALDSQTRLLLQELFLNVWERTRKTALFVTHDIAEAIFLSDTVVVFTSRPGRVMSVIPIALPRPRLPPAELSMSAEYQAIFSRIWNDIKDEVRIAE